MLKEMLNVDTMFDFALFESGINELLAETNHIDLYMHSTYFQAALNLASLTDRLDQFFECVGCVEMDMMVYNIAHAYYQDPLDESCIGVMKQAVQDCFDFYRESYLTDNLASHDYAKVSLNLLLNATDWEVLANDVLYFLQEIVHMKKFNRISPDLDKHFSSICDGLTTCYYIYSRLSQHPSELTKKALFANSDCETALDLMKQQLQSIYDGLVENN